MFGVCYSYVCFVSYAQVLRRAEFEILSTQSRGTENPTTTAKHRILYQRNTNQQTITASRDKWKLQQNPRYARRNRSNQAITITHSRQNA